MLKAFKINTLKILKNSSLNYFGRLMKSSCSNFRSLLGIGYGFPDSSIQYHTLLVMQHSLNINKYLSIY